MRYFLALATVGFFAFVATDAQSAERDESMEFWRFLVGTWTITNDEGEQLKLEIRESDAGSCFIFESESMTIVHGWNPKDNNMRVASFHSNGDHGVGYAYLDDGKIVGHSDTSTMDGTARAADWSVTPRGDDQFVFALGDAELVFDRE